MTDPERNGLRVTGAAGLLLCLLLAGGCQTNTSLREDGLVAYQGGDYPGAAAKFARAVELADNDYQSYYYLGRTQLKLGKYLDAQLNLERALALRSNDPVLTPNILDYLAEAYYQQNRPANLSAFLQKTASDYGTSRDFLRQGKYLAMIGDADGARVALRKAAYFAAAGDAEPYLAMADFYHQLNDLANEQVALRYAYYVNSKYPGLADRLRALGVVPGPTMALEPPRPEMLN
ncbi:MAG: hypothetical protein IT445_03800 [Phycisphaeraceae bacterium]|nr:hypothetical protein [Phycisphaeraceae bacterium]